MAKKDRLLMNDLLNDSKNLSRNSKDNIGSRATTSISNDTKHSKKEKIKEAPDTSDSILTESSDVEQKIKESPKSNVNRYRQRFKLSPSKIDSILIAADLKDNISTVRIVKGLVPLIKKEDADLDMCKFVTSTVIKRVLEKYPNLQEPIGLLMQELHKSRRTEL